MKNFGQIRIFATEFEWREELIQYFYSQLINVVKFKGRAIVALSGGSTPYTIYERLAHDVRTDPSIAALIQAVEFILVDERVVPLAHPDSNGGKLKKLWQGLPLKLHLIDETLDPAKAALTYENHIKELLDHQKGLDLVLLGMGTDGHTASLFPGSKGLEEKNALFMLNVKPDGVLRYTLSFKALREANERIVLLSGKEKLSILNEMLQTDGVKFPIEKLMFDQGSVLKWFYLRSHD